MPKRLKAVDTDVERFGIRITHNDGSFGWIVGPDCDYLLFDSKEEAVKALRKMKRDERYSWNCIAEAMQFKS